MNGDDLDAVLGFCPHTWYVDGDILEGGCPGNEGASHLCGEDAGHTDGHRCQDCNAVDPVLEVPC